MKFDTHVSYSSGTKPIEIGYDRSIISPSPHTNVLPEKGLTIINIDIFNIFKKFGTYKFHISLNKCADFYKDRSIIDHSSHINPFSENHFNGINPIKMLVSS